MSNFLANDILNEDEFPMLPLTFDNPSDLFPPHPDILAINSQLERLNIDSHTQSLRTEMERVKHQKLRIKPKRVKRELLPNNKIINNLSASVNQLQESVSSLRYLYEKESAHLQTVSYR